MMNPKLNPLLKFQLFADSGDDNQDGADGVSNEGGGDSPSDSSSSDDWKGGLPEDIRAHPDVQRYTSLEAMAKGLINANRMIGSDKITIPTNNSTPEEWSDTFRKLGAPEKPDGYDIKFEEGVQVEEGLLNDFKEQSHKLGLLPQQVQGIMDWYNGIVSGLSKTTDEIYEENVKSLKQDWGNDYHRNLAMVKSLISHFGDESTYESLESGWGNDAGLAKFLFNLSVALAESPTPGDSADAGVSQRADIHKQISNITGDLKGPYHNVNHANHKAAVEEVRQLYEKLAGADNAIIATATGSTQ